MNKCQQNDIFYILSQLVLAKHNGERKRERERRGITVFTLSWAEAFSHLKELQHTCAKAEEMQPGLPTFSVAFDLS